MIRTIALSLAALTLTACGTTPEPIIRIQEVMIPVPVSCVPEKLPPAPEYPDPEAATDRAEWLALTLSADELRRSRLADLEPVIERCRGR